jgi:cobalt/nickel transport system ATP-binding protein
VAGFFLKHTAAAVSAAQDAVAQAEAGVQQAQADVLQAQSGVTQAQAAVEVARAAVLSAEAQLAQVKRGPTAEQITPTVREEIAYGPRQLGLTDTAARVDHWAGELRLTGSLDKAPFNLSGGEKQKVALACLLALEPELLLLDEPAASLDPATVGWLVDTLVSSDRTVVVSTHNLSMAAELGNRCIVLGQLGEILFDGPVRMALTGMALLEKAGLAHRHRHRHGGAEHVHVHGHDWDG